MIRHSATRSGIQQGFPTRGSVSEDAVFTAFEDAATALGEENHPVDESQPESGDQNRFAFGNDIGVEVGSVARTHIRQPVIGREAGQRGFAWGRQRIGVPLCEKDGRRVDDSSVVQMNCLCLADVHDVDHGSSMNSNVDVRWRGVDCSLEHPVQVSALQ